MMKIKVLLFCSLLPLLCLGKEDVLKLEIIPSPNLVQNADFSRLDSKKMPENWYFDNCSKSPRFRTTVVNDPAGNYLAVDSEWIKFGYWLQTIPVKEGVTYYVSCDAQSNNPTPAIWLQNKVQKSSAKKSPGKVRYIVGRSLRNSDVLREALRDFVDESLISNMSPVRWNSLAVEATIPLYLGITECEMRIGVYGGNAGQVRLRKPVFREAKSRLNADVAGTGWTELRIKGAQPGSIKLDPAQKHQKVSFTLPRALFVYKVELIGSNGRKITREITNE